MCACKHEQTTHADMHTGTHRYTEVDIHMHVSRCTQSDKHMPTFITRSHVHQDIHTSTHACLYIDGCSYTHVHAQASSMECSFPLAALVSSVGIAPTGTCSLQSNKPPSQLPGIWLCHASLVQTYISYWKQCWLSAFFLGVLADHQSSMC